MDAVVLHTPLCANVSDDGDWVTYQSSPQSIIQTEDWKEELRNFLPSDGGGSDSEVLSDSVEKSGSGLTPLNLFQE